MSEDSFEDFSDIEDEINILESLSDEIFLNVDSSQIQERHE